MNTPTVDSIDGRNPPAGYQPMLEESIDHFLAEYRRGGSDFSVFESIFFRLVQTMADPPLEIIWFYSAVTFHSSKSTLQDPSKKVLVAKDLFQLLVSCSNPCDGLKRVAAVAPVVYELFSLVRDFSKRDLCSNREIEGFVEGIVSYITICCANCSEGQENGSDDLILCFVDLIRVWTVDRVGQLCNFGDALRVFFPLLSDEIRRGVDVNMGCGIDYLAGVVMSQAFLLSLCMKFGLGTSRDDLYKDMQNWAIQTIKGFQNCYFLDMLLKMLLEPSLPVTNLLSSGDEVLLRSVLYDVLLVEYSFSNSGRWTQLPGNCFKNLALLWLLVADNAIWFVRENCDHSKAMSYLNGFSECYLCNQLIKWVSNQTSMQEKISRQHISTPKALIRWLLVLEDQGIRVFDHDILKIHAKAIICKSRVDYQLPEFKPNGKNPNGNIYFHLGNERRGEDEVDGDQEMVDSLDDAFSACVCPMNVTASDGQRKRKDKDATGDGGETRVKLVKFNLNENSAGDKFFPLLS